jgi:ABC-2 type transport system permease protein
MAIIFACIKKELLLLRRDLHGLLLLFGMPTVFILIMSMAMQGEFAARAGKKMDVLVTDHDHSALSRELIRTLESGGAFKLIASDAADRGNKDHLLAGDGAFAIDIPAQFGAQLGDPTSAPAPLGVLVAPDVGKQTELIFIAALREAQGKLRLAQMLKASPLQPADSTLLDKSSVSVGYAYVADQEQAPSAVQQSVPAWLVFAIFFVVIPVSNTMIRERQQGTLRRLRSTNAGTFAILISKWLTYFGVNQLQVIAMLLVGTSLLPLFGGEALSLNGSLVALALIGAAVSAAALGYALLLAVLAETTEQATLLGGAGNIILAAIGGIMVPKFVMPAGMQKLAECSPMAWGLDGFLDILLRNGGVRDILPEVALLTGFGLITFIAAAALQERRSR